MAVRTIQTPLPYATANPFSVRLGTWFLAAIANARFSPKATVVKSAEIMVTTRQRIERPCEARNRDERNATNANPAETKCRTRNTRTPVNIASTSEVGTSMRLVMYSGMSYPSLGPKQSPLFVNNVGAFRTLEAQTPQTPNLSSVAILVAG